MKSTLSYLSRVEAQSTTWDRWLDKQVIAYERSFHVLIAGSSSGCHSFCVRIIACFLTERMCFVAVDV